MRDFLIGVRFVDGTGQLINAGGKVVKNAAGFDLPKLMVGSIGQLGVIVQLSFKVFPRPLATMTLEFTSDNTEHGVESVNRLARGPVELEALELLPDRRVLARIGGRAELLEARAARVETILGSSATNRSTGADEERIWTSATEFGWLPADASLVRVGLSIGHITALDRAIGAVAGGVEVRYGIGGTVAWIAWPADEPVEILDTLLGQLRLRGMVLIGPPGRPLLGAPSGGAFGARVTLALDPHSRFLEL